jgi:hypothetical protein
MKDYDAWAWKMKNNLIMCSVNGSTTTVWTMSGGSAPPAAVGNTECWSEQLLPIAARQCRRLTFVMWTRAASDSNCCEWVAEASSRGMDAIV